MEVSKEKILYILQFFFDKGTNIIQVAKTVKGVYSPKTVTTDYVQFRFRRFRSGMPVVENVDKITEMIEVDRHFSSCSAIQELKIGH
ncbi:histone-lysine N-methyltransferase SETMAR [Trichonephila clavata]|uniref:Histone-lysine N-methyltransferase SETMAR n=1 Tax=Trichonephila clavata TaxID=2740835 RepID=A0A8X6I7J5_TRICU|nr:histone-lysine N-methyltransferase SETMAR [Trichonephila clavata]